MAKQKLKIVPIDLSGSHKTGSLSDITVAKINAVLGFKPNQDDDPDKVVNSWGFQVNGHECGIWDYYGSHLNNTFSTYGPSEVFIKLFGNKYKGS